MRVLRRLYNTDMHSLAPCIAAVPTSLQQGGLAAGSRVRAFCSETHGGDDIHRIKNLIADFSVTTNALGAVTSALQATTAALLDTKLSQTGYRGGNVKALLEDQEVAIQSAPSIEHYPRRYDHDLYRATAEFITNATGECPETLESQLLFGNGASEVIDLAARLAPAGPFCTSPHTEVQYREYERACKSANRQQTTNPKEASVICLVNPNNPTGFFLERGHMEQWIEENAPPGCWVTVDESMLFWGGPKWRDRGVSRSFVRKMATNNVSIFIVHSWTKIFSCTGLRIGSIVCPTDKARNRLAAAQVPWLVNVFAQTYLKAAIADTKYLQDTWKYTPLWRKETVKQLKRLYPTWEFHGEDWLSWVWVDTKSISMALEIYNVALEAGCPVRHATAGYAQPTVIRIAVRRPSDFASLYQALVTNLYRSSGKEFFGTYADVDPALIERVDLIHIDDIKVHEEVIEDRAVKLQQYLSDMPVKSLPAIIVDSKHKVLLDGHHRLDVFRAFDCTVVPAVFIAYDHEDVLVTPPGVKSNVSKEDVIRAALFGPKMPPKSTQHVVRSKNGSILPIMVLAPQIAEMKVTEQDATFAAKWSNVCPATPLPVAKGKPRASHHRSVISDSSGIVISS